MKNNKKQHTSPHKPRSSELFLRMGFWFLITLFILSYVPRWFNSPNSVELSYSQFKQQIQDGNVARVTMQGEEIQGKFTEAYRPPEDSGKEQKSYKAFTTIRPPLDDPELIPLLETQNVTITAEKQSGSWLGSALILLLPWLLIIGLFLYGQRKMSGQMSGIFGVGRSKAKRYEKTSSDARYDDIAGLDNAKKDMREVVEYLQEPDRFTELGANIPKGILLVGPPGTGKTLLARATAGEADVPFFSISGSEFIEMFVGVGASRVRDMFDTAKKEAPAIIFIDEIDSIGRSRGAGLGGGHDEREQTLNQILSEMDGFTPHQSVIVLAATNRPDVLDAALTRPGRFDRQITLDLPQKEARREILRIHSREVPLAEDVDFENLAARTVGFSGAQLENLVNEAALLAGRKQKHTVSAEDFDQARDKILLGAEREEMMDEEEKKLVAYHEAGHALMAKRIPNADPLQKVTIIPRGRALGATEQTPEEERHNFTRQYLLDRIAIMMGGRAAEKLIFDDFTNGAAGDLKQVTRLARKMVTQWGMSEHVGPVFYRSGEEHPFLGRELAQTKDFSDETGRIIDQEVQKIITEMEKRAAETLRQEREHLDQLANALLEHETLENEDIERILAQTRTTE